MNQTQSIHDGMDYTDRCKFCREFGEKVWPRVCADCFEMALALTRSGAGWISLAVQLPPQEKAVLLCAGDGGPGSVATGFLRKDDTWEVDVPRGVDFEPAWWQYPPKAPEFEAHNNQN